MKGNRLKNRQKPLKTDFVTLSISSSYKQASKRAPFTMQTGIFYNAKEHLLKSTL